MELSSFERTHESVGTELNDNKQIEKESVRGLYIVGLLAILVTIKLSVEIDPMTDQFLFYVITSWAVYSFCMIFAHSNLPKGLVAWFSGVAEIFLLLSLFVSVGYFIIVSYVMFTMDPMTVALYFIFGIVMVVLIYFIKPSMKRKKML